jgi:acetoacetyl-CoA reductase
VALVTGGQRGIGAAISEGLQAAGRKVVASYAGNDAAAQEFTERTGIPCVKFDVSDFDACMAATARIAEEHGPVEILVNNAGITRDAMMRKLTRQMWDEVIDTNLGSCYNMCKAVWDSMSAAKFGRIVNIGSVNGQAGQLGQVNYAAAKSGIHGFTKALAQEGARNQITVNAIAPGYVDTEMVRAVPPTCWRRSSPASRAGGSAPRRTSPAASSSSPPTRPTSSPARRCPSMAGSTCIEARWAMRGG